MTKRVTKRDDEVKVIVGSLEDLLQSLGGAGGCHCAASRHHVILMKDGTYKHIVLPKEMTVLEADDYLFETVFGVDYIAHGDAPPPVDLSDPVAVHRWIASLRLAPCVRDPHQNLN